MRLDYQILLKSPPPTTLLAGSTPGPKCPLCYLKLAMIFMCLHVSSLNVEFPDLLDLFSILLAITYN